jgi:hypothetical protein
LEFRWILGTARIVARDPSYGGGELTWVCCVWYSDTMQALVLAKSRCQSELLQTADRAMAAAREAAALEATYEARKLEVDALQVRRFVRSAARPSHPPTLLIP